MKEIDIKIDKWYIAKCGNITGYILQLKEISEVTEPFNLKYPYTGNYMLVDSILGKTQIQPELMIGGSFSELVRLATQEELNLIKDIIK